MNDEEYFKHRQHIENKHYLMTSQWINFFNPETVLDCGCGAGQLIKAFQDSDVTAMGFDKSRYIVEQDVFRLGSNIFQDDIIHSKIDWKSDLVIAFDILEHIEKKDLKKVLNNLKQWSTKNILISVPVIGDPNLNKDITHKIFEKKEWWIKQFETIGKIIPTPTWFSYYQQIFIIEVNK